MGKARAPLEGHIGVQGLVLDEDRLWAFLDPLFGGISVFRVGRGRVGCCQRSGSCAKPMRTLCGLGRWDLGDVTNRGMSEPMDGDGMVDGVDDVVDYFGFSITETRRVGVRLSNSRRNADVFVEDSSGNVLSASRELGKQRELLNVVLSAGDYFVRVEAQRRGANSYGLRLGAAQPDAATAGSDTSVSVPVGGQIEGEIDPHWDLDWVRMDLEECQAYVLEAKGLSSDSGTLIDPEIKGVYIDPVRLCDVRSLQLGRAARPKRDDDYRTRRLRLRHRQRRGHGRQAGISGPGRRAALARRRVPGRLGRNLHRCCIDLRRTANVQCSTPGFHRSGDRRAPGDGELRAGLLFGGRGQHGVGEGGLVSRPRAHRHRPDPGR